MTVSELIQHLQAMPPDALVVTEGYEDGFDTLKKISMIKVVENPKKNWYVGQYIHSTEKTAQSVVFLNAETRAENL